MTALTPALAVEYVRELSADVRAVVVLDASGGLLAGSPGLESQALALLEAGGGAAELEAGGPDGVVCAVRSDAHAAIAVCSRFAIGGIVRSDLRTALAALEGRAPAAADAPAAQPGSPAAAGAPPQALSGASDRALTSATEAPPGAADPVLMSAAKALISAVQRDFTG